MGTLNVLHFTYLASMSASSASRIFVLKVRITDNLSIRSKDENCQFPPVVIHTDWAEWIYDVEEEKW